MSETQANNAVAVYCASSLGHNRAYQEGARSLGVALAEAGRPLVYGGGNKGIMGVVSGAALEKGGKVTGVVPYAMVAAGGEAEQLKGSAESKGAKIALIEQGREKIEHVVVDSMHERKQEMAARSSAFIGLPGGFGTYEEVLEVITWSQLGIHRKPVVLLNILGFWEPFRDLVNIGAREGFIQPQNTSLVKIVDGPEDRAEHEAFDWGKAAIEAIDSWTPPDKQDIYDWTKRKDGAGSGNTIGAI